MESFERQAEPAESDATSPEILRALSKHSCRLRATLPLALFALSRPKGVAALESAEVCAYVAELLKVSAADESRLLARAVSEGISAARFLAPLGTPLVLRLVSKLAAHAGQPHANVLLAFHFAHATREIYAPARAGASRSLAAASPRHLLLLSRALLSTQAKEHRPTSPPQRRPDSRDIVRLYLPFRRAGGISEASSRSRANPTRSSLGQ